MSLTIFLAIFILGCDLMIFVIFKWAFGEKYRARARRVAIRKAAAAKLGASPPHPVRSGARHRDVQRMLTFRTVRTSLEER
jgi:hypothetical protein